MGVPGLSRLDHGIQLDEELAHTGYQGHFGWLAGLTQMLVDAAIVALKRRPAMTDMYNSARK